LINADPDRITQFEEGGYRIEEVKKHILGGQRTDVPTPTDNSIPVGGGARQVLVSIDKEFYDEDQAKKQEIVDAREAGIKPNTSEGEYGSPKISHEVRKRIS
jgi:hypothetical protein